MIIDHISAGRDFIQRDGRLLERRLADVLFDRTDPRSVVDALRGYQNPDGGFGHALEPDTRCPLSLPIYTEFAFETLVAAGAIGTDGALDMVQRAADQLLTVADAAGAVALADPAIEQYPRAAHWTEWTYQPALNPTAGLAGALFALGVQHEWLDRATAACWSMLDRDGVPGDAHGLSEALHFLADVPDSDRADAWSERIREALPTVQMLHLDPATDGYGLTPLDLAPSPNSRWRQLFGDSVIDGHLQRMIGSQDDDGGWPVAWTPPGTAALVEWRAIITLRNIRVLRAYG